MRLGGSLVLLDRRDVEGELDLVGDDGVAATQRGVEGHLEVAARELAGDLEAGPLFAIGPYVGAAELGSELDLARDAVQGQVAADAVGLVVDRLDGVDSKASSGCSSTPKKSAERR